jgi:hypothetical protein
MDLSTDSGSLEKDSFTLTLYSFNVMNDVCSRPLNVKKGHIFVTPFPCTFKQNFA